MAATTTSEKILDAAEELFAEEGFSTSLRSITAGAGANLAAVNYHFGSKDGLIRAVMARRLAPLNRERIELLDRLERQREPPLERIVEAFVGPALRMSENEQGARFMRLYGHTLSRRDDHIIQLLTEQFREVIDRFTAALARKLSHLDGPEVFWRFMFLVGSMAHTMALSDKLPTISGGVCESGDARATIRRLVPFLVAGLRAPVPEQRS